MLPHSMTSRAFFPSKISMSPGSLPGREYSARRPGLISPSEDEDTLRCWSSQLGKTSTQHGVRLRSRPAPALPCRPETLKDITEQVVTWRLVPLRYVQCPPTQCVSMA